jgi:hypothetical protein
MDASSIGRVARKGPAMEKALCYGALAVSALMSLLFLLDLIAGMPFGGGPFRTVDIFGFLASAMVVYLAFNASRDAK